MTENSIEMVNTEQTAEFAEIVDQLIERLQRGEKVEVEAMLIEHPQHREQLRAIWSALEAISQIESPSAVPSAFVDDFQTETARTIGDYRIVRQIGRGGMGIVFEAEQISLKRRVALKVLPFAALLDDRALQRFKNEVAAAAQIEHPNIVDVYAVACDKGVHHYAMRLVRGSTVSEIITCLRAQDYERRWSSGFSSISDRVNKQSEVATKAGKVATVSEKPSHYFQLVGCFGVSIARALDCAHQQGVVHRDVKPSNLIIDNAGKAWITDFGLAQIEHGTAMTATGDVLGTARYMSPEQLVAKRAVLDHRTDVYSLGVTLYECLAFRPPFEAEERQELFRQIAFEPPRGLRTIQPAIPVDLETIVLMAMEKRADDRYQTAADFADDLERFLNHHPIRAQRPTTLQRFKKWLTRHPAIVYSTSVALLLGFGGFVDLFGPSLASEK